VVTDVMFSRLVGCALINSPFRTTVWSLCAGRLNSLTPINLNSFFPAAGADGTSLGAGAFALLGTGSVALTTVQLFGLASFKQPVTLTMSTFGDGEACAAAIRATNTTVFMARMIAPVRRRSTQNSQHTQRNSLSLRVLRFLRLAFVVVPALGLAAPASAHDLERTQVWLGFSADGSFVLDVANDAEWLKLRLAPFGSGATGLAALAPVFIDRVVLFVDGHEVRPASAEYIPPGPAATDGTPARAIYRLRGRMPADAHTLRWYYGLVIDPYPLTIRRVDGRSQTEWILGDAWSGSLDLGGQFQTPLRAQVQRQAPFVVMLAMFALALRLRMRTGSTLG
jgi:hypothetical protein